jgi:hypothetical protein
VLVTSAARYRQLMDWMHVPEKDRDTFPDAAVPGKTGGWVSMFEPEKKDGMPICMVAIVPTPGDPAINLSKIVHEAVHVWQNAKQVMSPNWDVGREPEAYAIQRIYDTLMEEYANQVPNAGKVTAAKPRPSGRVAKRTRRRA